MTSRMKVIIGLGVGCGCLTLLIPIGGILLAIALPSFLNQGNKARESEAVNYVKTILRAEQGYFLETGQLADSVKKMGLPLSLNNGNNYDYSIKITPGNPQSLGIIKATPKGSYKNQLKSYVGIVRGNTKSADSEAIACKTNRPGMTPTVTPPMPTAKLICPGSMVPF
jgi:type IV pilus assembly protein PilA